VVDDRSWMTPTEFEDGVAAVNLLPGPASTQLAIYSAWLLRGPLGALLGALCFIGPGLVVILALAALFLAPHPSAAVVGLAAGAGAAVPAVAVAAARALAPASWDRAGPTTGGRVRWLVYIAAGGAAAATIGPWLVLVLLGSGLIEVCFRARPTGTPLMLGVIPVTGLGGVAWVAFKVGALSYGGGFVIIPLMQHDAVSRYHWMTAAQFLSAVALGQVTPGPVVQTVAVVGYAAGGLGSGLLASLVAFAPSFAFVVLGGPWFARLRSDARVQAFLTGAGPAAVGAIAGSAIPLAMALTHGWQFAVLGAAAVWLLALRRGVVSGLVGAALVGLVVSLA
jgi:chromate transporter